MRRPLTIIVAVWLLAASAWANPAGPWMKLAERSAAAGQLRQAERFCRLALGADPLHDGAYLLLQEVVSKRGPLDSTAQRDALAGQVPEGMYLTQSDHYLIVYDVRHAWADSRAKLLELAHDRFYKELRTAGFRPLPLAERAVCVLFDEHADYERYSRHVDRFDNHWASGHYSLRSNRVAFFNLDSAPHLQEMVAELRRREAVAERLKGEAARDPRQRGRYAQALRQVARQRKLYELNTAFGNIQQTLHEAAHQLAFNTNIQSRTKLYPMWFSEGLATCFESYAPAAPFGPTHDNPSRRKPLVEALRASRDIPLSSFVSMLTPPDDKAQREITYAQAWGLWHYLFNHRRDQMRTYIAMMKTRPATRDPDEHAGRFAEVFGDPAVVHRQYRLHVLRMN